MGRMARSAADEESQGAGDLTGWIGTFLVVAFTFAAALANKSWWLVFIVGWPASVVGAFVAAALAGLLYPMRARLPERVGLVLLGLEILVGASICVTLMVLTIVNWA